MNSADHRGVAAINELETNEQTGHSCAPEVAGAINVGLEAQRKDTAGASHLSAAPQPVQTAEDARAALPFEEVLKHAYYYDEKGEWRGPDADEWTRWHAVARAALASKPVQGGEQIANCIAAGPTATDVALWQAMNEAEKYGLRTDDKLIRQALNERGYYLVRSLKKPGTCEDLIASAPAQPVREPMWQPIETAPKDGALLLLWEEHEDEPFIGFWCEHSACWEASTTHYDTDGNARVIDRVWSESVTHWMPLPAAPGITKE